MKLLSLIFLLCCLMLPPAEAAAAEADSALASLKLQDAVSLALDKGYQAKIERLRLIQAQQNVAASRGRFRTQVDLTLDSPDFRQRVQAFQQPDELPQYNTVGTTRWASGLSITQPLPTDGRVSLTSSLYQTKESVLLEDIDEDEKRKQFWSSFRLELRQPLFVPNQLKLGLERANLETERARRSFTRTELDVVYRVTESYFGLYRARQSMEIARDEAARQEQSYDLARRKFDAGLIPEVEALQMEVDLAQSRNRLLEAEGMLAESEDMFKLTVGLPLEERVTVDPELELKDLVVDGDRAIQHGLAYRAEIREREISRRLAEISLKEVDARSTIRADVRAYYDLTGVSDPFLDFSTGTSRLFRSSLTDLKRRPKNYGVMLTVSVPIWDSGVNRAEVAAANAILESNSLSVDEESRQVAREIRAVLSQLKESRNRVEVLKRSEEVARRGFEISQARFDNGDITSQELALDRDRLTQARQQYLGAFIAYQLALADLKRNTLYDWENDRSLVDGQFSAEGGR